MESITAALEGTVLQRTGRAGDGRTCLQLPAPICLVPLGSPDSPRTGTCTGLWVQEVQVALRWSQYSSPAAQTSTEDKWGQRFTLHSPFWRCLLKENIHWTRILLWIAKRYSVFFSFLLHGLLISYSHHLSTLVPGLSTLPCWHWSDVSNCSVLWPFFWLIPSSPPKHTQRQSSCCSKHYAPLQERQHIFLQWRKCFQLVKRRAVLPTSPAAACGEVDFQTICVALEFKPVNCGGAH